jgi:hypothetical protein
MNILIDQDTAEVVHIDLGVAFEQGLMLKTPERVCDEPEPYIVFSELVQVVFASSSFVNHILFFFSLFVGSISPDKGHYRWHGCYWC